MFKYIKTLKKIVAYVLSIIILSGAVSLPAVAKTLTEQATYNNILSTDSQNKESSIEVEQLINETGTTGNKNSNNDMTDKQQQELYQQETDKEIQNLESNRFIVKYSDEKSVPQFGDGGEKTDNQEEKDEMATLDINGPDVNSEKITSAGIESSRVLEVKDSEEFTLIETTDPMSKDDFEKAMETAGLEKGIEYIQPDYEMTMSADPLLDQAWGLNSTQISEAMITVGADVSEAWAYSTGDDVVVAVLDSGIDIMHSDLENNVYANNHEKPDNGIDDDGNGYIDDVSGWDFCNDDNSVNDSNWYYDQWHGTHVAGIIAAEKDNDIGIAGVAPNAIILPIKIFEGGVAYTSDIIDAIAYAESMGAEVINCSWGSRFDNPALEEAIVNSTALFVCAAGNNLYNMNNYPVYPAAYSATYDNVISVAAIDQTGKLCRFSNYGQNSVDIAAPGKGILSTWINDEYQSVDGTSMSAAYVSGAAALTFAKGDYDTASTVKERLIDSADTVTGLEDKIIDGKILNCAYVTGNESTGNENVFNVEDNETLPVIIPNTEPSQDDYQQSNAENVVVFEAPMGTERQGLQAGTLNGMIYAIGGQTSTSGGYTNTVEAYDPNTDTWTAVANMNTARANFGAVVYGGKIYVMGGINSSGYLSSMEYYDPTTNIWTNMSTTLPAAMSSFSATIYGSNIYVVGGYNGSYKSSVYDFNLSTSTWTAHTNLSMPISNHVAFYYNGMIYIEGGLTSGGAYTYSEYTYTISTGTTSSAVWARSSLSNAAGILTNDRFIAIGGKNSSSNYSADITQSSLLTDNTNPRGYYITASNMQIARSGLGVALLDGKVYIIGGIDSSGVLSSVEMLDLGWHQKASLPALISNYKSVQMDGKIYVMGGSAYINGVDQNSNAVYMYNSLADSWSTMSVTMPVYAKEFSLTAAFGKIYMFGGLTSSTQNGTYSASDQIYEYNPTTGDWTAVNTLSSARSSLSSVLYNGIIYITGGSDSGASSVNTVEAYDPITNSITEKNNLPSALSGHYTNVMGGTMYLFTSITSSALKYNTASDSWTNVNPSGSYTGDLFATINNYLYIFGTINDNAPCPGFYKYLSDDNICNYFSTFNYYGNLHQTIESNNRAYFFTGTDTTYSSGLVEYNPPATSWSSTASLNTPRYSSGVAVLDGNIYCAGGCYDEQYKWEKWNVTTTVGAPYTLSLVDGPNTVIGYTDGYYYQYYSIDSEGEFFYSYPTHFADASNAVYCGYKYKIDRTNTSYLNILTSAYMGSYTYNCYTTAPTVTYDKGTTSYGYVYGAPGAFPSHSYQYDPSTGNYYWYVFVGSTALNTLEKYNETTNTWTAMTGMTYPRYGLGVATANGKLYAIGGTNSISVLSSVEEYNPSTDSWTTKTAIPVATTDMAIASYNNVIYIFGGKDSSGNVLNTVYAYNPSTNAWSIKTSMPTAAFGSGAAVINGKVYVAGGFTSSSIATDKLQVYDPSANTWDTIKASLPQALGYAGVVSSSDYLYAIGGSNGFGDMNCAYQYSPTIDKWLTWEGPNKVRYSFGAAITNNGIYAIGGKNVTGCFTNVEFATINSLMAADYLHFGDEKVNLSGNYARTYTDMSYTGPGFSIDFSRTYNSQDDRTEDNIISTGWTLGFQGNIDIEGNNAIVRLPKGNGYKFQINPDGSYAALDSRTTLEKQADNSYILTTKDQYTYGYNGDGYLTWMKDRNGNTITITLNASNQPTQVTDQAGNVTTITYSGSRISTITDPTGRVVTYTYNANNQLYRVKDPNGNSTYYFYTNGYLTSIKDDTSSTVIESVTYLPAQTNELPRVGTITDIYGNVTTYTYIDGDGLLTATDSNGRTTNTWYDKMVYPIRTVDPEGKETRTAYNLDGGLNKYGEVSSYTDRNGNTTYYLRDDSGNVTKQINPDGSYKEYTYDSKNNVLSEKDELGKCTFYVYDASGINLLKMAQPLNGTDVYSDTATQSDFAITTYTYYSDYGVHNINGLKNTVTDPEGNVTTYTYDQYGNTATITSPESKTTTYDYNILGWLQSVTTPKGYTTTYYYDKNGNVLKQVNPDGGTVRSVYDFHNYLRQTVQPEQYDATLDTTVAFNSENIQSSSASTYSGLLHGSRYVYYENGLLHAVFDPLNNATNYTYDLYGNKLSEKTPEATEYGYTYTVMDLIDTATFKESAGSDKLLLQEYNYEILANGNTTMTVTQYFDDTNTSVTTTTYDYAGRQIRLDQADGTYTTNTYNDNGTLASVADARGNTTYYSYDGLNRLKNTWTPVGASTYSYSSKAYDNAGKVISVTQSADMVANGTVPTTNLVTVGYTYDADGNVTQELSSSGAKKTYEYDDDGNLQDKYVYYDASNASHESYTYNNMGQLTVKNTYVENQDIIGNDTSTELVLTSSSTYDLNGNVLTAVDENGVETTYTYDLMNRILTTSQPGLDEEGTTVPITTSQTYDWAGNVLTTIDPNNSTTTFTYDKQGNLNTVSDALDGVQYYTYDRAGRKIAEVSPNNHVDGSDLSSMSHTEYSYDEMGRVSLVTQVYYDDETSSWKQFVSAAYTYDGNGNVTYEQDALGYQNSYGTTYEYDKSNRVAQTIDPEGHASTLSYDGLGRTASSTDANNVVTSYTYDDDGNMLTVTVGGTLTQTNTYDLKGNLLTQTDGNGNTTTYTYNDLSGIRSMTLPGDTTIAGHTTTYKYTKLGQLAQSTDSLDKQQLISYDNQGNVLTTTEQKSDGTEVIMTSNNYDEAGNLRYATDGNGTTVTFTYDALGRNVTKSATVTDINSNSTTQTTTYTYDADGNVLTEQDWRGNAYTNTYDSLGRLILSTDPYGKTIEKLVYNDNGAQISSTDALGNTTQYVYDRNNQLVQTIDAMGHSTYQYYDGVGNVVRTVDGNGNATDYDYDNRNRLVEVENALDETTTYTYDANGNQLTQTDGEGNTTIMTYNCRDLLIERVDPSGILPGGAVDNTKAISYTYYADGNVASMTDGNGVTTTYTYDIHGRTISTSASGETISTTYDNNGNQLTVTNSEGTITRTYDELGRVISKTVSGVGTSTIQYDVTSGMATGCTGEITTDSKGNSNTKTYDRAGRLYQVVSGSDTTTYAYYDNGNRESLTYPNGLTAEYTYYADNSLHTLANMNGGTYLSTYNYAYDANGNLLTVLDIDGTTTYTYDELNRLESVTEPSGKVTEYTFDASGNRATEEVTDAGDVALTTYTYTAQNRLTTATKLLSDGTTNSTYYFYDNTGNTISSHEESFEAGSEPTSYYLMLAGHGEGDTFAIYTYDVFNQMLSVSDNDSVSAFSYNAEGLRLGKTVTEDDETTTTVFAYEYSKAVLELGENGDETAYNVYGGDMLISRTTTSDGTLYYLYNGHGDVVQLTDSNGTVVMTYDYDAFGVVTEATGTITNSYMFCGYMYDEETGLFYVSSRYYDPVVARFMSADTYLGRISDPLSLNLYTYCKNEPLMYYDPTGHADIAVRSSNEGVGNEVIWNDNRTITIVTSNGSRTLQEGTDFYIDSNGTAYYTNNSENEVRSTNESAGSQVNWTAGSTAGNSQIDITYTTVAGNGQVGDVTTTMTEGVDYYIGSDGKAYYYSNVRSTNQSQGDDVTFIEGSVPGYSCIQVTDSTTKKSTVLLEGSDYYIGADGQAHFFNGPPSAKKSTTTVDPNGGTTGGSTPEYNSSQPTGGSSNLYGIDTHKLVTTALSQVGYAEGKYWDEDKGKWVYTNDTKYGEWYGWNRVYWCAEFVAWCVNKAGISPDLIPNNTAKQYDDGDGDGINCASTGEYRTWYREQKRYQNVEGVKGDERVAPHEGDIVIFGDHTHIGIVIAYDENTGTVYTVEGNSGQQVSLNHYDLKTTTYITGFCINGSESYGNIPGGSGEGSNLPNR